MQKEKNQNSTKHTANKPVNNDSIQAREPQEIKSQDEKMDLTEVDPFRRLYRSGTALLVATAISGVFMGIAEIYFDTSIGYGSLPMALSASLLFLPVYWLIKKLRFFG